MKNVLTKLTVLAMVMGLFVFFGTANAAGPQLTFGASQIDLAKETKINVKGTGFNPGQKLIIIFTDANGVLTDIEHSIEPAPVANDKGEWSTTFNAKDFIKKKLIKAGEHMFKVADSEYNVLASASLKFVGKPPKKKKK